MRVLLFVLSLALLSLALGEQAFAKKVRKKRRRVQRVEQTQERAPVDPKEGLALQASNREGKNHFGAGVEAGLIAGSVSGYGLNLFYPSSRHWYFGLEYLSGKTSSESEDLSLGTSSKLSVTIINLYARWFAWESFNLFFGPGQRVVDYTILVTDSSSNRVTLEGKATSLTLNFGLGNIWTFDSGFYLGCEWIAYMQPISSGSSSSTTTEGEITVAHELFIDLNEKSSQDLAKVAAAQLLLLNLGFVF